MRSPDLITVRARLFAHTQGRNPVHSLNQALRLISRFCGVLAAAAVGITAAVYVAEVVARYGLNSPINISGDVGSYMLCVGAFLGVPIVTRQRRHIAVTVVLETLPPDLRKTVSRILEFVCAAVLLIVAYFVIDLCIRQYHQGVLTSMANQIPRWWLTAVMAFGLLLTAFNFIAPADETSEEILDI
jgi:TRAP-type C4-dicarboxylate transport system permease small subunit